MGLLPTCQVGFDLEWHPRGLQKSGGRILLDVLECGKRCQQECPLPISIPLSSFSPRDIEVKKLTQSDGLWPSFQPPCCPWRFPAGLLISDELSDSHQLLQRLPPSYPSSCSPILSLLADPNSWLQSCLVPDTAVDRIRSRRLVASLAQSPRRRPIADLPYVIDTFQALPTTHYTIP